MNVNPNLNFLLLLLICGFISTASAQQQNESPQSTPTYSFLEAFVNGQTRALFRYSAQYRNSNLHTLQDGDGPTIPDEKLQQYSAIGGYFGYQTAAWLNITFGATVYGAVPAGPNDAGHRGLGGLYEANGDQDPYAALGELYVKYQSQGHLVKVGRQEMPDYRMVSLSDIRVSPVTHSGAVYENRVIENLTIDVAYIRKMKERNARDFIDMATGARLTAFSQGKQVIRGSYDSADYDASGYLGDAKEMTMLGLTYKVGNFSFEAWNYYVNDFVNSAYFLGQYSFEPTVNDVHFTLAAQYTRQVDVGGHIGGNIDTWHYGVSFRGYKGPLSFFAGYNEVAYNENSYDGGTLFVRWGTPQMFNSFQVQDSELAGEKSLGAGVQYDFGRNGLIPGVVMRWRYGNYDLPDKLYMTDARQDRREATFDLRYSFTQTSGFGIFTEMQGLSLQFRLAYNHYDTDYNFAAYREIHGYEFESVTSDFIDARLYLDYHFN